MSTEVSSRKSTLIAALLLTALVALLASPRARAADPFRLDRIGVVRFTPVGANRLAVQQGVLPLQGPAQWRPATEIARPANTPDWALNRPLITVDAWLAYYGLGFGALYGFMQQEGGVNIFIGEKTYKAVGVDPEATPPMTGPVINLSTRAVIATGGEEVTAGFVIEGRTRAVLLRVVGPGLGRFGVANAATDPFLGVRQNGYLIHGNDNWSAHPRAALTSLAATRAGAFPLDPGSRDAATVLLLQPGAYTVHATLAPGTTGGSVLIEIYSLPEDADYDEAMP